MAGVKHRFVSAKADGGDATLVRPSNWNADHDIVASQVEPDLGPAKFAGRFTITDALILATSKVLCWQATGPYTGKGTAAGSSDEGTMDPIQVTAVVPAAGSAVAYWQTLPIFVPVPRSLQADAVGPADTSLATGAIIDREAPNMTMQRRGLVKGNVKFNYLVLV